MMRRLFSSLRLQLMLLVLLALLPTLILTLYSGFEQRRLAVTTAREGALRLARLTAADYAQLLEGANQLLHALALLPQARGGEVSECNQLMADLLKQYRIYSNFGVVRPDGLVFCSAVPAVGSVSYADRDWFRQVLETRDFVGSDYLVGRITGKAQLAFGYPVIDQVGRVRSVVFASLDLSWLNHRIADADLPSGAALLVVDRGGIVLARYPDPQQWIGKAFPDAPLAQAMLAGQENPAVLPGLDGVRRLYAMVPLPAEAQAQSAAGPGSAPGYVAVGIPVEVAYAEVDRMLLRNLALLGLVLVLALLGAWVASKAWVLQHVDRLLAEAERLGQGDLRARVGELAGATELNRLAHTLDRMAGALEQRQDELSTALTSLRNSETRFRQLAENISEIFWLIDLKTGAMLYVSPAYEGVTGRTCASLYENPRIWRKIVHPDDRRRVLAALAAHRGQPLDEEFRIVRRDGAVRWSRTRLFWLHNEHGELYRVAGSTEDITERREAIDGLARRAREMAALYEISLAINSQPDLPTLLQVILARAVQLLDAPAGGLYLMRSDGASLELAVGHNLNKGYEGAVLRLGQGLSGRIAQTGEVLSVPDYENWAGRAAIYTDSGFRRVLGVPLRFRGRVIGVITVTDTERRGAFDEEQIRLVRLFADQAAIAVENVRLHASLETTNHQLQLAVQARDEMLQNVSHELRTPLTHIRGYSELMVEGSLGKVTERQADALRLIMDKSDSLTRLVTGLLTLQTFSPHELRPQPVDVNAFLDGLANDWRSIVAGRFEVAYRPVDGAARVCADPQRLRQVFDQLFDNAVKYTWHGGQFLLSGQTAGGYGILCLSDTGVGIPADKLEKVFERFYQIDGSTTRAQGGAGIGLALVRKIIESHGGSVWAESPGYLGCGTTFCVKLPLG